MFVFTVSYILHELAIYSGPIVRLDEFAFMSQKSVLVSFMVLFFSNDNAPGSDITKCVVVRILFRSKIDNFLSFKVVIYKRKIV